MDKALSNRQELNDKGQRWNDISLDTKTENERTREPLLPTNELKRNEIDNARNRINRRSREIAEQDSRISMQDNRLSTSIREYHTSYEKRTQQLRTEFQGFKRENERNRTLIQARFEAVRDILQSKFTELRERIRNSFKKTINKARQIKRDFGMSR